MHDVIMSHKSDRFIVMILCLVLGLILSTSVAAQDTAVVKIMVDLDGVRTYLDQELRERDSYGSALAPGKLVGDATDDNKVDSNLIPKVSQAVDADSANHADTADFATTANFDNPTIVSDLAIIGHIKSWMIRHDLDFNRISGFRAQDTLRVLLPSSMIDTPADSFVAIHPGAAFISGDGWADYYPYVLTFNGYPDGSADEDFCMGYSRDNNNFGHFVDSVDQDTVTKILKVTPVLATWPYTYKDTITMDGVTPDTSPPQYIMEFSDDLADVTSGIVSAINSDPNTSDWCTATDFGTYLTVASDSLGKNFTAGVDTAQNATNGGTDTVSTNTIYASLINPIWGLQPPEPVANAFVVASHDSTAFCGIDTCFQDTMTYISDGDLFPDKDGTKLWAIFRGIWASVFQIGKDTTVLFVTSTTDGLTWTEPVRILGGIEAFVSPTVLLWRNGTYRMWVVQNCTNNSLNNTDENIVTIYEATGDPDGIWTLIDTTNWYAADTANWDLWHINVIPFGADQLLGLGVECNGDNCSSVGNLRLSVSNDGGITWNTANAPIIVGNAYRPAAIWVEKGNELVLGLYEGMSSGGPRGIGYSEWGWTQGQPVTFSLDNIHVKAIPYDSSEVTFLEYETSGGADMYLVLDSSVNGAEVTTLRASGDAPCDMTLDSLFVTYKFGDATSYIDAWAVSVPKDKDNSSFTNNPDSLIGSDGTNQTGTSWTRSAKSLVGTPVYEGNTIEVQLDIVTISSNKWIKISKVQIYGRRKDRWVVFR